MMIAKWVLVAWMSAAGIITYDDGRFVVNRIEDAVLSYCYDREVFEEIIALEMKDREAAAKLFQDAPGCHTGLVRAASKTVLKTVMTSSGEHYFTEMEMVGGWLGSRFFPNKPETIYAITPYPTAATPWKGEPGTEQNS